MSAQLSCVSSGANCQLSGYHLHFADSQADKVCAISSGESRLQFAIATAIAAAQLHLVAEVFCVISTVFCQLDSTRELCSRYLAETARTPVIIIIIIK